MFTYTENSDGITVTLAGIKDVTTFKNYLDENNKSIKLPCYNEDGKTITVIGSDAFNSNSITTLEMGDNVKTIGSGAFNNNDIEILELGNGVETIGYHSFSNNNIKNLVFPDSLKRIEQFSNTSTNWADYGAFYNNPIESIVFGSGIEYIGANIFYNVSTLKTVDFSRAENLTTIGLRAFYGNGFPKIEIPSSVTTIGASAFAGNSNLTEILVKGKTDSSGFTSLGSSWNGTCTNIVYSN